MSKHSKNNTANPVFSYAERQKLGYGTQTTRVTRDHCRDFDACHICLKHALHAVCCPKGHLACKECVIKSLVGQKEAAQRNLEAYKAQAKMMEADKTTSANTTQTAATEEFLRRQTGVGSAKASDLVSPASSQLYAHQSRETNATTGAKLNVTESALVAAGTTSSAAAAASAIPTTAGASAARSAGFTDRAVLPSFWLPSLTPAAEPTLIEAPDSHCYCYGGTERHTLKLKQLVSVHFTPVSSDGDSSRRAGNDRFMCPACRKTLINGPRMSVLRPCGHVFCDTCMKKFVTPSLRCQTCERPCGSSKDIIVLASDGSGYTGHGGKNVIKKQLTAGFACT